MHSFFGRMTSIVSSLFQFLLLANAIVLPCFVTAQSAGIALKLNHTDGVNAICYSTDGRLLATASADNTVKIWSAKSGELLSALSHHQADVFSLCFSPDGSLLASGGYDRSLIVWEVNSGEIFQIFKGHQLAITSVAFSPDGNLLASASRDSSIHIWNLSARKPEHFLTGHTSGVNALMFANTSDILISGSLDGEILVWNMKTGKPFHRLRGHKGAITSLSLQPGGSHFASGSLDGQVNIWSTFDWMQISRLLSREEGINALSYNRTGKWLGIATSENAQIWNLEERRQIHVLKNHNASVQAIAFSPESQMCATGDANGQIRVWRSNVGRSEIRIDPFPRNVNDVAFSPDGKIVASGNSAGKLNLWNVEKGALEESVQAHNSEVWSVAFDQKGRFLATTAVDGTIKLWNISDFSVFREWGGHEGAAYSAKFSPDGLQLVTTGDDRLVRVWDVLSGQLLKDFSGHLARVWFAEYSPDGGMIVSAGDDYTVRVWNTQTGMLLRTLLGHTALVRSARFTKNGTQVVSASSDKLIKVWDIAIEEELYSLQGHSSSVKTLAFSPDNKILASGGFDNVVRLWNWRGGKLMQSFIGHENDINALAFSPNGQLLASSGSDGAVRIWDLAKGKARFVFSAMPDDGWFAYSPGSVYYNSSEGADNFAALHFEQDLFMQYPLSAFSNELKSENLAKAVKKSQPIVKRSIVNSDKQARESNYVGWLILFVALTVGAMLIAIILLRKGNPSQEIMLFFHAAGYPGIRALNKNTFLLNSNNGVAPGIALDLADEGNINEQRLINKINRLINKAPGYTKLYLIFGGNEPSLSGFQQVRRDLPFSTIPLSSETLKHSLLQRNSKNILKQLEAPYISNTGPFLNTEPAIESSFYFGHEDFFERVPALRDSGKFILINGLPCSGLTSTVYQSLKKKSGVRQAYINCNSLQFSAEIYLAAIIYQVSDTTENLKNLPLNELAARIVKAHAASNQAYAPFQIALDSIDSIFLKKNGDNQKIAEEFSRFIQVLGVLVKQYKCIDVIMTAGRTERIVSAFNEQGLGDLLQSQYLGLLTRQNVREMLISLGALVDVQWEMEAVNEIFLRCGGHPYLVKSLAGQAFQKVGNSMITSGDIQEVAQTQNGSPNALTYYDKLGKWLTADERALLAMFSKKARPYGIQKEDIPVTLLPALDALEGYGLLTSDMGRFSAFSTTFDSWLEVD